MNKQTLQSFLITVSFLIYLGGGPHSQQAFCASDGIGKGPAASPGRQERHYSMKASVRPLLFWISCDGVGGGRIAWTDDGSGTREYELLIGSDPLRAPRRINRWGYISERITGSSAELIGVMSRSDEQTMDQADAGTNQPRKAHAFNTIRSYYKEGETRSLVTPLFLSEDFCYRDFEVLVGLIPKTGEPVRQLQVPQGVDPGFLFAVQEMLHRTVASYKQSGQPGLKGEAPRLYVYNASLYSLSIVSSRFLGEVTVNGRVYPGIIETRFETRDRKTGKASHFSIHYGTEEPLSEVPVRIVYQPRWWFQVELLLKESPRITQTAERMGAQ